MDLTLQEIFDALALIETDAKKVLTTLTSSYPTDHFLDVIEETYGNSFDNETETKLSFQIGDIKNDLLADMQAMGDVYK